MVLTRVGRAASACAGLLLLREAWLWWTDGRNFLAELTVSGEAPDLPGGPPSLLELGLVIALFAVGVLHLRRLAWSVFVTTTLLVLTAATVWLRLWWIFRDGFQLASVTSAARVFLLEPGWENSVTASTRLGVAERSLSRSMGKLRERGLVTHSGSGPTSRYELTDMARDMAANNFMTIGTPAPSGDNS